MTTPLSERHLQPGYGRVYLNDGPWRGWSADYRDPQGAMWGAWAKSPAEAANWIRSKAKEAQK